MVTLWAVLQSFLDIQSKILDNQMGTEVSMIKIVDIDKGSPADRRGLKIGESIIAINGEKVMDSIDYQALIAVRHVCMLIENELGKRREVDFIKPVDRQLGITLENKALPPPRECANNCLFCFVDQMPEGMRPTLYVKDDDWRYSLMMGNFITLTNVGEHEFDRIIRRKASPLFISVHATDPEVRRRLIKNPHAGQIMERLRRLKDNSMQFHCQLVLCPGINDGAVLEKTLEDLYSLRPNALSVAAVPVGLTKFRDNLPDLPTYDAKSAQAVLDICAKFRERSLKEYGNAFIYPADEFICITRQAIPDAICYDDFPQLENGIGMLRLMEDGLRESKPLMQSKKAKVRKVLIPCGVSVAPYMQAWTDAYAPSGVDVQVVPIKNNFFGATVTVTGLLTATDILEQIQPYEKDEVLISESMLNSDKQVFLDDMTFEEFRRALPCPCYYVHNKGEALLSALIGQGE